MVPKKMSFEVPKSSCKDLEKVEYETCQKVDKEIKGIMKQTCEVKNTTSCHPEKVKKVIRST